MEVSYGTGTLLTQFADQFETYAIEYNEKFVTMLQGKLRAKGIAAQICQSDVNALPYGDQCFDSIVNTMAFTAYPDGYNAMSEMHRVLKSGGKLIIIDIAYPLNRNVLGMSATRAWIAMGDIVRDMAPIFESCNLTYSDEQIGGFGSVHLYIAHKH